MAAMETDGDTTYFKVWALLLLLLALDIIGIALYYVVSKLFCKSRDSKQSKRDEFSLSSDMDDDDIELQSLIVHNRPGNAQIYQISFKVKGDVAESAENYSHFILDELINKVPRFDQNIRESEIVVICDDTAAVQIIIDYPGNDIRSERWYGRALKLLQNEDCVSKLSVKEVEEL